MSQISFEIYTLRVFLPFVPFLILNLFFGNLINFTLGNPLHSQTLILFLSKNLKPSLFIHGTLKLFTLFCKPFPSLFTLFVKPFSLTANTLGHFHSHYSRQSLSHALSLSRKHSVSSNPLTAKPNTPSQKNNCRRLFCPPSPPAWRTPSVQRFQKFIIATTTISMILGLVSKLDSQFVYNLIVVHSSSFTEMVCGTFDILVSFIFVPMMKSIGLR